MKVTTITTPIDALMPQRSVAIDESAMSFPDTLREARVGSETERTRADGVRTVRSEREDRAERARETDSEETSVEGVEETGHEVDDESANSTGSESDTSESTVPSETAVLAVPLLTSLTGGTMEPVTGGGLLTDLPATPVATVASSIQSETLAAAPLEVPVPGLTEQGKSFAKPAAVITEETALETKTLETHATTSGASTGTKTTEGETAVLPSRGEPNVAAGEGAPLAAREAGAASAAGTAGESSWFRAGQSDTGETARASFHLLDGAESAEAETRSEISIPRVAATGAENKAANATTQARVDGVAPESIAPTSAVSGATSATPLSAAAATRAASEVISTDPADPSVLARRIFRSVRRSLARGEHELTLRLDPPRLGRVDVDLKVNPERIGIRFVVESEEVRDTLRAHIDELHRSLDGQGFRADSVEIDLREETTDGDRTSSRQGSKQSDGSGEAIGENSVEDRELRLWHLGKTVDLKG